MEETAAARERQQTGIDGLDLILHGGLPPGMVYLLHGGPGTGKTTLGFQFLREGVRLGQRVFYISLLQSRMELEIILASHGWSLEGIELFNLPENIKKICTQEQTLFAPDEIELPELTEVIHAAIRKCRPQRLVFDSITELALLEKSPYYLHRHLLKMKEILNEQNCTTLYTVTDSEVVDLPSLRTVVHGILTLGIDRHDYCPPRRWLEPVKMRGMTFLEGRHDFRIRSGGLEVYPRQEFDGSTTAFSEWPVVSSGNTRLDTMFGGGLEEGTACLVCGTTGAGKSTLASLYVQAAAARGERSIIYCFDERRETFIRRAAGLDLEIGDYIRQGLVRIHQINVDSITQGQFAHQLCRAVNEEGIRVVVLDTINGYFHVMMEQRQLMLQLHELLNFLGKAGVLTLIVAATHDIISRFHPELDASYIADTVVMLRNFEAGGLVRRCMAVLKKRHGNHEKSIREFMIGKGGFRIGEPLQDFRGILSGNPEFFGDRNLLLNRGKIDDGIAAD